MPPSPRPARRLHARSTRSSGRRPCCSCATRTSSCSASRSGGVAAPATAAGLRREEVAPVGAPDHEVRRRGRSAGRVRCGGSSLLVARRGRRRRGGSRGRPAASVDDDVGPAQFPTVDPGDVGAEVDGRRSTCSTSTAIDVERDGVLRRRRRRRRSGSSRSRPPIVPDDGILGPLTWSELVVTLQPGSDRRRGPSGADAAQRQRRRHRRGRPVRSGDPRRGHHVRASATGSTSTGSSTTTCGSTSSPGRPE